MEAPVAKKKASTAAALNPGAGLCKKEDVE